MTEPGTQGGIPYEPDSVVLERIRNEREAAKLKGE